MKHIKPDLQKANKLLPNHLQRNKSGDKATWQSPTRQSPRGQGFKSIIEEINQQNERTFSLLDQDLKRIKNNLNRIQQESIEVQQSSQNDGLKEEIQLLQQENQRLKEKNTLLINEKKKMSREIQQYESLVQREKIKQMSSFGQRPNSPDTKVQGLTANNRKLKQQLQSKQEELQKLKTVNSQLVQAKSIIERRQSMLSEEKNKLLAKIMEIQKEKNMLKLRLEEELKTQLDKKDAYYAKILKSQEAKFDQSLIKFKENTRKATLVRIQQTDLQNKDQIQRLNAQNRRLKDCERQLKNEQERLTKKLNQCIHTIEGLTNEIEVLSFSYKQNAEQLEEKNEQLYDLRQRNQSGLSQVKKLSEEISGLVQRCEEQGKKCTFLQQLCSKLQKESQQNQYEADHNYSKLIEVISSHQKELQRYKAIIQAIKKEKKDVEEQAYQLARANEKCMLQLKRKSDENIVLKKENLVLLSHAKNLRLQNTFSPPKHEVIQETQVNHRLQRLHSARSTREELDIASVTKMRKIEKELNDLIYECKQENDKTKAIYKDKELKLSNTINAQKVKIDELTLKIQQLQKEFQLKTLQSNKKQQNHRENMKKKDAEILIQERKCSEIGLKLNALESDNSQLKKNLQQFTSKKVADNHSQCWKKVESLKQENKRLLNKILNEINLLAQTSQVESNYRTKGLEMGLKEVNSYEQIQKIAQINFAFHALRQTIKSMNKRLKQLSLTTKSTQIHNQTSCFLDKSSLIIDENMKSLPLFQKKSEKILKFSEQNEDSIQRIIAKSNEFERKYERLVIEEKRKNKEIQDLNDQIRQQKRQLSRLKYDLQASQDQRQDIKMKLKACLQRLASKQAEKIQYIPFQRQHSQMDFKTPSKQLGFYRSNNFDSQRQIQQANLRSRVRSFRSCDKQQNAFNNNRDFQRKLGQYQIDIGKLTRELDLKQSLIEEYEKQKTELQNKQKKTQSKYQKKVSECQNLQERYELQLRLKAQLQSKINELEYQLKILVDQIQKQNRQNLQIISNHSQQLINKEKEIKELLYEKDVLEKKLKKEIAERQEKIAAISQQYDLKILDSTSEIARLKENTKDLKKKLEATTSKYEQMLSLSGKTQEKIYQSQLYISELKQKLSRQQKQKQEMLSVFSSNTSKLSKIIQEKQIQIQELKFIQESTIINSQYVRTQHARKRQDQSAFSFKHQF